MLLDRNMQKWASSINHKEIIPRGIHAIALLGHVKVENSKKRRINVRNTG